MCVCTCVCMLFVMMSRRVCQHNVSGSDCSHGKKREWTMGTGCSLDLFTGNMTLNEIILRNETQTLYALCVYVFLISRRTLMNV